jgi:hypothetical protein
MERKSEGQAAHVAVLEARVRELNEARLYNVPVAKAIAATLAPGFRLIYRDAFRWKDARDDSVLSNHYDGQDAPYLAEEWGYDIAADLGFAAILRDPVTPTEASR